MFICGVCNPSQHDTYAWGWQDHFYVCTQVFKHNLLTIVQDHHKNFLHVKGINLTADVTSWHEDFDVESLPDIDNVDFPLKPFVEVVKSAPEMIKVITEVQNSLLALIHI